MELVTLLAVAFLLLCPLSMYWMMRRHRHNEPAGRGDLSADRRPLPSSRHAEAVSAAPERGDAEGEKVHP